MAKHVLFRICVLLWCLGVVACGMKHPVTVPMNSAFVVEASAEDIVRMMLHAGFEDAQIIEHGTTLRNGLALYGGTQIHTKEKVKAVFAVIEPNRVYISTLHKGSFIYDITTSEATR